MWEVVCTTSQASIVADSIGTVIASMLSGPIVGSISGAINNIIYGLTMDPISSFTLLQVLLLVLPWVLWLTRDVLIICGEL